jgi:hypothetical protein
MKNSDAVNDLLNMFGMTEKGGNAEQVRKVNNHCLRCNPISWSDCQASWCAYNVKYKGK